MDAGGRELGAGRWRVRVEVGGWALTAGCENWELGAIGWGLKVKPIWGNQLARGGNPDIRGKATGATKWRQAEILECKANSIDHN